MEFIGQLIIFHILPGYFAGSIPFGLILTKIFTGKDLRQLGSGNIGATNVLRTGNKILALATLLLDSLKGTLVVIYSIIIYAISKTYFPQLSPLSVETVAIIVGFSAILGHCFPIWLKFKGGKGVATALGVLLAAVPYAGLAACVTWLITAKITKISSLSALIALAIAPIITLIFYGTSAAIICTLISALVFYRHKDNIKRLLNGTEPKIGQKKNDAPTA